MTLLSIGWTVPVTDRYSVNVFPLDGSDLQSDMGLGLGGHLDCGRFSGGGRCVVLLFGLARS